MMHKTLTPYGYRKTDRLNKAQLRKVASMVHEKSKTICNTKEFINRLIEEYPALKRPEQQKKVVERAEKIRMHEAAVNAFTARLLERIG